MMYLSIKNSDNAHNGFDTANLSNAVTLNNSIGQMDRRTDGLTDRIPISVSRVNMLTCEKNRSDISRALQ